MRKALLLLVQHRDLGPMGIQHRLSRVRTPYGVVDLETTSVAGRDFEFMGVETEGTLVSPEGQQIGNCRFVTYRRKRNRRWMAADSIVFDMDNLSSEASELSVALASYDEGVLEKCFNKTCLLVADRVEVFPPFRGGGAWKTLYFSTMEKALEPFKVRPDEFFFKCFPLEFENIVTDANRKEFKRAERALILLYSVHLNARRLDLDESSHCFMRAPVPRLSLE